MAERKVPVALPTGKIGEGFEVPVEETTERWSDVTLEDGTHLRLKTTVLSATRILLTNGIMKVIPCILSNRHQLL